MPDWDAVDVSGDKAPRNAFDYFERTAKIVALVAIPIVIPMALAIYSARTQQASQVETINRDYVQLAVSILKENKENMDSNLRDWAVTLLNEHSPTKFSTEVADGLKNGTLSFPDASESKRDRISVYSQDHAYIATADSNSYSVWRLSDNTKILTQDTVIKPTVLTFSPDSKRLAIGFMEGWVSVIDIATGQEVAKLQGDAKMPVELIRFVGSSSLRVYFVGSTFVAFDIPQRTPSK
jgi:WD40 repeat protein